MNSVVVSSGPPKTRQSTQPFVLCAVLLTLIVAAFAARLWLIWRTNINWDEFYFLSKIYSHERGELSHPLLTFHVHFLSWITGLGLSEVDQIILIRGLFWGLSVVGAISLISIVRNLTGSLVGGLVAVFAVQSFSLVLQFGSSARFDPPIVTCFLVAAALITSRRRSNDFLAAALLVLALLLSIKAVFYLPTIAALLLGRRDSLGWGAVLRDAAAFALVGGALLAILTTFHAHSLASPATDPVAVASSGGGLTAVAAKVFESFWSFPNSNTLIQTMRWDSVFWGIVAIGLFFCLCDAVRGRHRVRALTIASFFLPLLTLTFYRNTFPYFYVSLVPPAAVLIGAAIAAVERLGGGRLVTWLATAVCVVPMAIAGARWILLNHDDAVNKQRQLLAVVHEVFPEPVPYIDRCSMVVSFPKVGLFMSTWVTNDYRDAGIALYRNLLRTAAPRFLIDNVSSLKLQKTSKKLASQTNSLLPDDIAALKNNFVPYWGPLWIAGKNLSLKAGVPVVITFDIPGEYVVDAEVSINGSRIAKGTSLRMSVGNYTVSADFNGIVRFRTAEAGPAPKTKPIQEPVFSRFRYRTRARR